MGEKIKEQKEIINRILESLANLQDFLIGTAADKSKNTQEDKIINSLIDDVDDNTARIFAIQAYVENLHRIIKGDK